MNLKCVHVFMLDLLAGHSYENPLEAGDDTLVVAQLGAGRNLGCHSRLLGVSIPAGDGQ